MEPNFQHAEHLQHQLNSANIYPAPILFQHNEIEAHRTQQIASLEEEIARLKQENLHQKEEIEKLKQKLHLQEPLLEVGINIRRRFLEKARVKRGFGNAVESIIEAGNAAAHRGNIFADSALFTLGVLRSTDPVFTPSGGPTEIEDNYRSLAKLLSGVDVIHIDECRFFNSVKGAEVFNLSATIACCSTMTPFANNTDATHRRFSELANRCVALLRKRLEEQVLSILFGLNHERSDLCDALDSCMEIGGIAEQVVGLTMGRNRYRMRE